MEYNLEVRTLDFGKNVLKLLIKIKDDNICKPIIVQLVRSSTSVGANYREANSASSKKDFTNKIAIARKEINETKYWIELLADIIEEVKKVELRVCWKEAHELSLIFNKIYHSSKNKNEN